MYYNIYIPSYSTSALFYTGDLAWNEAVGCPSDLHKKNEKKNKKKHTECLTKLRPPEFALAGGTGG